MIIMLIFNSDSDLKKILYNVDEAGNLVGKNDNVLLLPRFPDMVKTVVSYDQSEYNSSVLLEVGFILCTIIN